MFSGKWLPLALSLLAAIPIGVPASESPAVVGNRLAYLEEPNPFHPNLAFPKLTTPQWIGESDVEAVVIVSIDDMFASARYEAYLRPILERLKKVDGRSPVSIFSNGPNPQDPQLQSWLKEGLSFEIHTLHHPCPLLAKGTFESAWNTYHGCVDLLNHVPGNKPVAFRMPCCDSMNTPSPRFYFGIFDKTNSAGQFLTIDSSVINITSTNDPALPRGLTVDADGREKFRKYVPFPSFTTTIDDYPYPYQIGKTIWEFPCAVPSDWEGQHLHGTNNPVTVRDWKAGLDVTVIKQGVMTFVIHPHGWIKAEQMIEFIDYGVSKYGNKIKFLNFREAQQRLDQHLLLGQSMRATEGGDNGVRLLDLNNDGFMDVVMANEKHGFTRLWNPKEKTWKDSSFPMALVDAQHTSRQVNFGVLKPTGYASAVMLGKMNKAWHFDGAQWVEEPDIAKGLDVTDTENSTVRLRDVDRDGICELIVANTKQNGIFSWAAETHSWTRLPFGLPKGTQLVDAQGRDAGLRFIDVNEDGYDDVLFSNPERFSLHLFVPKANLGFERGWTMQVRAGKRGDANEIPMISRGGESPNNGAWVRNKHVWWQNENTADKPDVVDRRSFAELLALDAPPAKSPEESLSTMRAPDGFKVELVASEPLIADPIAFEWSADGKLWVVEMGDYPLGIDGQGKGAGKIRILEDTDGDGRHDKSTVFLDGLDFPTGLIPWRKGVLVSAAPEIFYAEDSDGDGKADVRKPLFTGFHPGNQQHRVNGFDYGLDNWIYGANGDSGGEITSVITGQKVNINGRDFRFHPDTGEFESESGQTQFGRHRDDWGNWFGNNNPTWLWHYVFPERYLVRNAHLPVKETKHFLANYADNTRVFPASRTTERFNWAGAANHVTSANSPAPYRDDLFGTDFSNSVFVSEPVHNCVHRELLEANGATFKSRRAPGEAQSEFLASTDNWFRPTMTKTGPDGALYVADMYRLVIEHPEWIPAERQKRIDLRAGADKGRIYRVVPVKAARRPIPNLSALHATELVAALDSPNGWQRDTAQRLLIERQDKAAVEPLKQIIATSKNPKARVQALCTLEGLKALDLSVLTRGFTDPDARVREHAVRVSEPFGEIICQRLIAREGFGVFRNLVDDPAPRVRFQLAFTLGEWNHPEAGFLLALLAAKDFDDPYMQTAIMSSAVPHVRTMLTAVFAHARSEPPPARLVEQLMSLAGALNDPVLFASMFEEISRTTTGGPQTWQAAALAGFLDHLDRNNASLADFYKSANPQVQSAVQRLEPLFGHARQVAAVDNVLGSSNWATVQMIRLLGRGLSNHENDINTLGRFLDARATPELQQAALGNLERSRSEQAGRVLLDHWSNSGPQLREHILNTVLSRPQWVPLLLTQVEQGAIPPGQIGAAHQQKLLKHTDEQVRNRAAKLFATNADRQKVLKQYEKVTELSGDASKGKELFAVNCATCHRFKDQGAAVGPDLGMMGDKPVSVWLTAILNPNQAVEARYINYIGVTRNDRELTGIIANETANSITLRNPGGTEETILRGDLQQLRSSGLSLMPEGLENALAPQQMADLLAYLMAK